MVSFFKNNNIGVCLTLGFVFLHLLLYDSPSMCIDQNITEYHWVKQKDICMAYYAEYYIIVKSTSLNIWKSVPTGWGFTEKKHNNN